MYIRTVQSRVRYTTRAHLMRAGLLAQRPSSSAVSLSFCGLVSTLYM